MLRYRLRDLLVLEALEVAVLLHAVGHGATLRLHPALCHQVQLCVQVHSLHFSVIVVVGREARVPSMERGEHHIIEDSLLFLSGCARGT